MSANAFDPGLFEHVACDFCGGSDYTVRIEARRPPSRDELVLSVSWAQRDSQRIVQCRRCGLLYVNPRPRKDVVLAHYERDAEDHYAEQAQERLNTFRRSLRLVERYATARGRLLDIGAAGGFFLRVARDAGWQVAGIEPNRWLCDYAARYLGVDITNAPLHPERFPAESFDAVTLWDVIEHLHEPSDALRLVHRWLKKDGIVVLSTPNAASLLARLFGRRWWFYLSVHLYYFTPEVLRRRMEQLGFTVLATQRYVQTLSLGHLIRMFAMYSRPLSRAAERAATVAGMERLPIRYYAAQFALVARKL